MSGGTVLESASPILQNAVAEGEGEFESTSYHFYGSLRPDFWRDVTDFKLQATLVNQMTAPVPYSANIAVRNLGVQDSTTLARETQLALRSTTEFTVASLPVLISKT